MKKLILSAVAVFAFTFANAQEATEANGGKGFSAGDVFISGSVGFQSEKTGDIKSNEFNIMPRAAYFVNNNIAIGLQAGFASSKNETPGVPDVKVNAFEIGAFGRYYFTPANDFSIFGQLDFAYATAKRKQDGTPDQKIDGFNVGLAPGVSYFLSKNIAIEATFGLLGYNTVEVDGAADSTDTFNIGLDLNNINFGIVYKF